MNLWIFVHGYICKKGLNFGQRQKQYVMVSTEEQKGKNKGRTTMSFCPLLYFRDWISSSLVRNKKNSLHKKTGTNQDT